jgi:Ca2+-binding EF-hand superfamily protein
LVQSLGKPYVQGIRKQEPYIEHITFEEFKNLKFGKKEFP